MRGVHGSFFVRWEGLAYWVQFLPTYSVAKFHLSNTHAPAISDDSCLFEVRQCATGVRGQADIFDGFCVSLGRPMSKIGPRKRLSEVSAAVF